MENSTKLPASIHGYDMFFENISQKDLEQIALDQRGVCSSDPDIKKVTCKFSQPVVINDASELLSILFAVRTLGEQIAKNYGATYPGGELYITGVGSTSSTLDCLTYQTHYSLIGTLMQSTYSHILSKIGSHLEQQISKIHNSYKGEHKFLNNLFVSPGDFYYGVFDTSRTDKAISKFSKLLGAEGFEIIFTDLEFDTNLKLLYCFDIRIDEMTLFSVKYDFNSKSFSNITCDDYDVAEWMLSELAEVVATYE